MLRSLSPRISRSSSWLCILALFGILLFPAASVLGDDEGQPADAAAEDEGAPAPATDEGDDEEAAAKPRDEQSLLEWTIEASGWWGVVLLLMSFIMVAIIVMNVLQVRRENMMPPEFIEAFEQKLSAKDYQGAYETSKADDSFLARVLAAGLGKLNRGYEEAIEGMQEVGEEENMTLEHRLSMLALIGAVAPMIGLMGTVWGMIASFRVIAISGGTPEPAELAKGVSTALFTTLEGLFVAIPAMTAYGILRNRVARFVLEVGMVSEGLMSRFSTLGKGKTPGGAAPAGAPAKSAE
jgi:biopolymer transport protein ExbB